ncbi:MAG: type I-E CRISPR-associated endonuclease Cas1e [Candidatus Nanopelagicales bacterium]
MNIPGAHPPELGELVRISDRISFLYVEHALISRADNAITLTSERGVVHVPAAQLSCILIGPGCRVTHHAIMLIADSGTTAVWCGENAVRFYASGRGLTRSSKMLESQARLVSNQQSRLAVARAMYEMRFPGEDVSRLSMQQLRGREGARVRATYREHSERTGVKWSRREYRPDDFTASDPVNMALSAANTSLYGVVHSVVVALGLSPGLGFVHTGGDRAFVHDIADLYKAEVTIPIAFDVAAAQVEDIPRLARMRMRDSVMTLRLLERTVADIRKLILEDSAEAEEWADVIALWDGGDRVVSGGTNYGESEVPW